MKLHALLFFAIVFEFGNSCNQPTEQSEKSDPKNGIVKRYWPDGSLKTEMSIKDGKRHGISKSYYKNGKLRQEVNYHANVKHGEAITYYEYEKPYQSEA